MLTVIGEALIDLVDSGDHVTFIAHPGGSPLNVAVGLARLGHPTALMARLAADGFGRVLREHAERDGVDLRGAPEATEPTTLAVVSLDERGRASYDFYLDGTADWQWTAEELAAVPDDTSILHAGSLATWTPPGDAVIAALMGHWHDDRRGLVSYDPNVRPRIIGTPERGRPLIESCVRRAHVAKASEDDLNWLYPGRDLDCVAEDWLALGPDLVLITRGPAGATAYPREQAPVHRPAPAIELVDTVGAGDAFTAGLLGALADLAITDRAGLQALGADATRLGAAVDDATLVAAITCERAGANPPTRSELAERRVNRGERAQ